MDVNNVTREELIQALIRVEKDVVIHERLLMALRQAEPAAAHLQWIAVQQTELQRTIVWLNQHVNELNTTVTRFIDVFAKSRSLKAHSHTQRLCFSCDRPGHAFTECTGMPFDTTVRAMTLPKNQQKRALRDAQRRRLVAVASASAAAAASTPAPAAAKPTPAAAAASTKPAAASASTAASKAIAGPMPIRR